MRKIALFSFYKSRNLGDILLSRMIAELFENCFSCKVDRVDFSTMSDNIEYKSSYENMQQHPEKLPRKLRLIFIKHLGKLIFDTSARKAIKRNEVIVLGGGNMLMDTGKFPLYSLNAYICVRFAKLYKKKVCFCFVGAGPVENKAGRYFIRKAVNASDFISVRDKGSKEYLKQIGVNKEIKVWNDIVWLYPQKIEHKDADAVGINVYLSCIKSEEERKKAEISLKNLINKLSAMYKVYLFSTEKADYNDISVLVEKNNNEVVYINSEDDLMELYSKCRIILATRMHTAITALTQGIPVVALVWQAKVREMMKLIKLDDYAFDIRKLSECPEEILEKVLYVYEKSDILAETVKNNRDKIVSDIEMNIKAFEI